MEEYFDNGDFVKLYPKIRKKYIDQVRRENYRYKKTVKGKTEWWYALLVVLKSGIYDEDKDNVTEIIKDLEIIKDAKAKVKRNGIVIKVMIKDMNNAKENNK